MACSGLRPSDGDGLVTHSAMSHRLWCRSRAWESGAALRGPGSGWECQRVRAPARRLPGRLLRLRSAGRGEAPAAFCTRPAIPPSPRGARAPRPSSKAGQAQVTGTLFFMSVVGLRYFISKESLSGGMCFHIREGLHPQRRSMAGSAAVLV